MFSSMMNSDPQHGQSTNVFILRAVPLYQRGFLVLCTGFDDLTGFIVANHTPHVNPKQKK
jgi:hypothetical protein